MSRECIGCLYDQPMNGDAHHREDLGPGAYYRTVCTRGPIERELRAHARGGPISARGLAIIYGAVHDMRSRRGPGVADDEALSEAIEAAAELGL